MNEYATKVKRYVERHRAELGKLGDEILEDLRNNYDGLCWEDAEQTLVGLRYRVDAERRKVKLRGEK